MGSRGEAARHDTSRAVLNFIGLIRGLFVRFAGAARRQTTRRCDHVLLSMQVGEIWREQIVWPNGSVHHFVSFADGKAAVDWIAAHARLTARPKTPDDAS
jgi:hypothetical protein